MAALSSRDATPPIGPTKRWRARARRGLRLRNWPYSTGARTPGHAMRIEQRIRPTCLHQLGSRDRDGESAVDQVSPIHAAEPSTAKPPFA